ncbi:MAG: aminotransferase class V-fold PLP-dependent enzyme [Oscillospiraceae bacterium]|nr:aminotransferase class V-fold PLP-dependent enzyme [Oscillospiraceae bacterium]
MIYLDNAATSYPKPQGVYRAWTEAIRTYGANPGRGGYDFSAATSQAVYDSRAACAELFGAEPENTVFTLNCTHSLNYAIKGLARRKVHFVISDLEHNAVLRPVHSCAAQNGGSYSIFETAEEDEVTISRAERAIRPETAAMICTAASNVTGRRLPLKALAEICRRKKICFIVDAAQGAGTLPLYLRDGINILCAAGHKGLYGPMGTGLLLTDGSFPLKTLIEGGTGSASESPIQPGYTPDRFESGTINTAGVIALGAGVTFVKEKTPAAILNHELKLCKSFCDGARTLPRVTLYNDITGENMGHYAPVVSFGIEGRNASEVSAALGRRGFCLRGGLHCAPLAHRKLGTLESGTVRFSPSAFTTPQEVDMLLHALKHEIRS